MAYCNVGDIEARIGEATLRTLSDRDQTGQVDVTRVAAAIADAQAEVDAYCQSRYTVPFPPPAPPVIKQMTIKLAIYELYARAGYDPETQPAVAKDRASAVDFLKSLASGRVTLGQKEPAKDQGSIVSASPRVFSRTKLEGF